MEIPPEIRSVNRGPAAQRGFLGHAAALPGEIKVWFGVHRVPGGRYRFHIRVRVG